MAESLEDFVAALLRGRNDWSHAVNRRTEPAGEVWAEIWRQAGDPNSQALNIWKLRELLGQWEHFHPEGAIGVMVTHAPRLLGGGHHKPSNIYNPHPLFGHSVRQFAQAILERMLSDHIEVLRAALDDGRLQEGPRHLAFMMMVEAGHLDALPDETLNALALRYCEAGSQDAVAAALKPWLGRLADEPERWRRALIHALGLCAFDDPERLTGFVESLSESELAAVVTARNAGQRYTRKADMVFWFKNLLGRAPAPMLEALGPDPYSKGDLIRHSAWILSHKLGRPLEETHDEALLRALQHVNVPVDISVAVFKGLELDRALRFLKQEVADGWRAQQMFGAFHDEGLYQAALDELLTRAENKNRYTGEFYGGLSLGGAFAREFIQKHLASKLPASVAEVLVRALTLMGGESASAMVAALGHGSKGARQWAQRGLEGLGNDVLPFIEPALLARRKHARVAAVEILEALDVSPQRDALLDEVTPKVKDKAVLERLAALARVQAEAHPWQEVEVLHGTISHDFHQQLRLAVRRYRPGPEDEAFMLEEPLKTFAAFALRLMWESEARGQQWLKTLLEGPLAQEPLVPWMVAWGVSDATNRRLTDRLYQRPQYTQRLHQVLGVLAQGGLSLGEPLAFVAPRLKNKHLLFDLMAAACPGEGLPWFLDALGESSKPNREAAIEGLVLCGEAAVLPVMEVLGHRKKDARQSAAQVLGRLADARALPALRQALGKERSAPVLSALNQAIVSCTPKRGLDNINDITDQDLEGWLAALPSPTLPPFAEPALEMPLRLVSGMALGPSARSGWFGLLMQEQAASACALARQVRQRLDAHDYGAISLALADAWTEAGEPKASAWAFEQLSIGASPDWIETHGSQLRPEYGRSTARGKRLVHVLARSERRLALMWLMRVLDGIGWGEYQALKQELALGLAQSKEANPEVFAQAEAHREVFKVEKRSGYWREPWNEPRRQESAHGFVFELSFDGQDEPVLGQVGTQATMRLLGYSPVEAHPEPDLPRAWRAVEKKVTEGQAWVQGKLEALVGLVAEGSERGRVLSWWGLKAIFVTDLVARRLASRMVFEDGHGKRFWIDPQGRPCLPDGSVHTFDHEGCWCRIVPVDEVDAEFWGAVTEPAVAAWRQRLEDSKAFEPPGNVQTRFVELRELLYDLQSWEALEGLLSAWSHDTLPEAVDYTREALARREEALWRPANQDWLLSLLPQGNAKRQGRQGSGARIWPGRGGDPRLVLCNALRFERLKMSAEDLRSTVNNPVLDNVARLSFHYGRLLGGADDVLAKGRWPSLESLIFYDFKVRPKGWQVLCAAPWAKQLKLLYVQRTGRRDALMEALVASGVLGNLESLHLNWLDWQFEELDGLTQTIIDHGPNLTALSLRFNFGLGQEAQDFVADAFRSAGRQIDVEW